MAEARSLFILIYRFLHIRPDFKTVTHKKIYFVPRMIPPGHGEWWYQMKGRGSLTVVCITDILLNLLLPLRILSLYANAQYNLIQQLTNRTQKSFSLRVSSELVLSHSPATQPLQSWNNSASFVPQCTMLTCLSLDFCLIIQKCTRKQKVQSEPWWCLSNFSSQHILFQQPVITGVKVHTSSWIGCNSYSYDEYQGQRWVPDNT